MVSLVSTMVSLESSEVDSFDNFCKEIMKQNNCTLISKYFHCDALISS